MHILIIPIGVVLWFIAYKAKPIINDEMNYIFEEENILKRSKLQEIIKKGI